MGVRGTVWLLALLPAGVLAQDRDGGGGERPMGELLGVVQTVDYEAGFAVVEHAGRSFDLRGTPVQLAQLAPGDAVSLPWAEFEGTIWIAAAGSGLEPPEAPVGTGQVERGASGTAAGMVTGVDEAQGLLEVNGDLLRAHPALLGDLWPGDEVRLSWEELGPIPWVEALDRAP